MGNDLLGEDLMGDNTLGEGDDYGGDELGAASFMRRPGARPQGRVLRLPAPPAWRNQVAPGVALPGEQREPLPLTPLANNGVFNSANTSINFEARPQRPFRGSRLIATVTRSGVSVQGIQPVISGGILVGTQVQQVELGDLPLDIFAPNAVGVGIRMAPSQPGITIRAPVSLRGGAPAGTDFIAVGLTLIGSSIA